MSPYTLNGEKIVSPGFETMRLKEAGATAKTSAITR